jgi:hypothetical protein
LSQDEKVAERGRELLAARLPVQKQLAPGMAGAGIPVSEEFCEWLEFWAMTSEDPLERILAADMRVKLATKNPEQLRAALDAEVKRRAGEMLTKVKAGARNKVNYNVDRLRELAQNRAPTGELEVDPATSKI